MPAPPAEALAETLRPLTDAPQQAAVFCDVDGTLAPIVERAENAAVPEDTSRLLGRLGRRYGCVACISGRSVAEARRMVAVGSIAYAGSHGAELLEPSATRAAIVPAFSTWTGRVHDFAAQYDVRELRLLRIRLEDKGPIVAFHWRGAPDEDAARTRLEGIAQEAEVAGFAIHWGRKVLEVRPPVPIDKGQAIRELVSRHPVRAALFGGDDVTDLDGFAALVTLREEGRLESIVRVGVRSEEGPREIHEQADLVVDGTSGFAEVLTALAG
ncbi:MAG: trehalose-phosphatase [Thermoleophilaceae bacterium]|nr:trehalose-phosphatase [Thermoleophilaceae bacterium]